MLRRGATKGCYEGVLRWGATKGCLPMQYDPWRGPRRAVRPGDEVAFYVGSPSGDQQEKSGVVVSVDTKNDIDPRKKCKIQTADQIYCKLVHHTCIIFQFFFDGRVRSTAPHIYETASLLLCCDTLHRILHKFLPIFASSNLRSSPL